MSIKNLISNLIFLCFYYQLSAQTIPWKKLQNPIYSHEGWSVKDACAIFHEDSQQFYVFFSTFFHDNGRERSHIVGVKTKDFIRFSEPLFIWDGQNEGWIGMCSPNISEVDGKYILTYNSWGDKKRKPNQLFYAESSDLENWKNHIPLATNITKGVRAIDASVFSYQKKNLLIWKRLQTPQVSLNEDFSKERWLNLGAMNIGWFENAQFFQVDEQLFLLCTADEHKQKIYSLQNVKNSIWQFTNWTFFSEISVPVESFNTDELMNASFILDHTKYDGYYYCIYAGRTEHNSHAGRGDNKLGITRSKDLLTWSVP